MVIELKNAFFYESKIGRIGFLESDGFIEGISLSDFTEEYTLFESEAIKAAHLQIEEYFAGKRRSFNIPYRFAFGTDFQKSVWNALCEIPYGETRSYSEIAARIGKPKASRAVGAAAGKNPLLIVVPCHRMIGKNGSMTGFACGVDVKRKLLEIEK